MQLAAIHHQLGNLPAAIEAYQAARDELDPDDRLSLAKLCNQIGIAHEAMGQSDRAKSYHARAIDALQPFGGPAAPAAVRFELARSRLLQLRQVRPGTGPQSLPPTEAFEMDFSRRQPRPPRFGLRMRLGYLFPPRETLSPREREPLIEIVHELLSLRTEVPDSVPVTLLLSHAVRQTMGDVLQARSRRFEQRWLVELADELEAELDTQLQRRSEQGNEAAIAYELVLLLSDFNVFRQLRPDEMDRARRRLTQGLGYARYLVDRYPNVPAYETLAIHTAYKLAVLQRMFVPDRREKYPERLRLVRSLMQLSLRGQQRLLEATPDGDGYAMWCSLFTMQIGDLQRFAGGRGGALQSYRDALAYLPLERSPADGETLATAIGEILRRYVEVADPDNDADAVQRAEQIARGLRDSAAIDWNDLATQLETLIGEREVPEVPSMRGRPLRRLDRPGGRVIP
jgi:tetratricopeptide (TPR) repeat protein